MREIRLYIAPYVCIFEPIALFLRNTGSRENLARSFSSRSPLPVIFHTFFITDTICKMATCASCNNVVKYHARHFTTLFQLDINSSSDKKKRKKISAPRENKSLCGISVYNVLTLFLLTNGPCTVIFLSFLYRLVEAVHAKFHQLVGTRRFFFSIKQHINASNQTRYLHCGVLRNRRAYINSGRGYQPSLTRPVTRALPIERYFAISMRHDCVLGAALSAPLYSSPASA